MTLYRRDFLKTALFESFGIIALKSNSNDFQIRSANYEVLDKILEKPVLKQHVFPEPVNIENVELLRFKNNLICRVRSKDGVVGLSVGNNDQLQSLYPIFMNRLQPFFPGKDVCNWDKLVDLVYVLKSIVTVPTGSGSGIEIDPEFIAKHLVVKS